MNKSTLYKTTDSHGNTIYIDGNNRKVALRKGRPLKSGRLPDYALRYLKPAPSLFNRIMYK